MTTPMNTARSSPAARRRLATGARLAAAALLALAAAGCAVFKPVTVGMTREQALAQAGRPTAVVPLAAGTRLQYSLQPLGQSVVMVDLDAGDRVTSVREVMTLEAFNRIEIGRWTRADVQREFGNPAKIDGVHSWKGPIYTYRWKDGVTDMLYYVYFDEAGTVGRIGQGMDIPVDPMHDD